MLQRHVDIARDFAALRDRLHQFVTPMRRVRVKQAHPKITLNRLNLAQEGRERRAARRINRLARPGFRGPQVHPVVGSVLADQVDFLYAFRDKAANLREDGGRRTTAMPAAHLRDDTETARVVAPFGDFQVDAVGWRETKARSIPIRNVGRFRRNEVVAGGVDPGRAGNGLNSGGQRSLLQRAR